MIRSRFAVLLACGLVALLSVATAMAEETPIEQVIGATFRMTNGKTSATAFLVAMEPAEGQERGQTVLVTAAHALEQMPDTACKLILRVEEADTYARQEAEIALRADGKPRWVRHPELDVAVLPVDLPEKTAARPLSVRQVADAAWASERKLRVGGDVYIPGYPATLEGNEAGWPVLRRGFVATHPLLPLENAQKMFVNAATFGGDSGAPVAFLYGDEVRIVGLVTGMQRQTSRSKMTFEEHVSHMPMALAITVQAPFICDTIELLGKQEEKEEEQPHDREEDKPEDDEKDGEEEGQEDEA